MKSLLIYILFSSLIFLKVAGQKKIKIITPVQKAVNHIDSVVTNIMKDSTIQMLTVDKTATPEVKPSDTKKYKIIAGYRNGQLVMLQKSNTGINFFDGNNRTVYFENGRPVLFIEKYSNSSRMGSCGQISVGFYHYLKDSVAFAGLAKSAVNFYGCYGYKLHRPVANTWFNEIESMKKSIDKGPAQKIVRGKSQLPPVDFWMNRDETIQESYGF